MVKFKVFNSPTFGEIRAVKDGDGNVLLVAADVARALFGASLTRFVKDYCKNEVQIPNPECPRRFITAIGVPDVCRMMIRSKSKFVLLFHDFVFDTILTAFRGTSFGKCRDLFPTYNSDEPEAIYQRPNEEVRTYGDRIASLENSVRMLIEKIDGTIVEEKVETCNKASFDDYLTVSEYVINNKLFIGATDYGKYGQRAASICKMRGIPIGKTSQKRYTTVCTYPAYVLQEAFSKSINHYKSK